MSLSEKKNTVMKGSCRLTHVVVFTAVISIAEILKDESRDTYFKKYLPRI